MQPNPLIAPENIIFKSYTTFTEKNKTHMHLGYKKQRNTLLHCENDFLAPLWCQHNSNSTPILLYTGTWKIDDSDYPTSINTKQQTKNKEHWYFV